MEGNIQQATQKGAAALLDAIEKHNLEELEKAVEKREKTFEGEPYDIPTFDHKQNFLYLAIKNANKKNDLNILTFIIENAGNKEYFLNKATASSPTTETIPIYYAIKLGNFKIVKLLVNNGATINKKHKTTIEDKTYHPTYVDLSIKLAAEAFEKKEKSELQQQRVKIVKYLLEQKEAELDGGYLAERILKNIPDALLEIPNIPAAMMHQAIRDNNMNIIKKLVGKNIDIEMRDKDGNTPLNLAVKAGNTEVIKFFINKKANVNTTNNEGNPPLCTLIRGHCHLKNIDKKKLETIAELLIDSGAKIHLPGGTTTSPLEYARRFTDNDGEAVALLLLKYYWEMLKKNMDSREDPLQFDSIPYVKPISSANLENMLKNPENTCLICQEALKNKSMGDPIILYPLILYPCGHIFHLNCIKQSITKLKPACPTCRSVILAIEEVDKILKNLEKKK